MILSPLLRKLRPKTPGLRRMSFPGERSDWESDNSTRCCGCALPPQSRVGVVNLFGLARSSQPWAGGHNPVGIAVAQLGLSKLGCYRRSGRENCPLSMKPVVSSQKIVLTLYQLI